MLINNINISIVIEDRKKKIYQTKLHGIRGNVI